ncbi:MAG: glucose-6-phosphate isomerase [Bacteroidales bacterium]|nr:glucose-6-phosphate isomerase [Candidatus Cacconaster merdequi]
MIELNLEGCSQFVTKEKFAEFTEKAVAAKKILESGTGAGSEFLGWNNLPSSIDSEQLSAYLEIVDDWIGKSVDLVVVIGIGGSYLGAKATVEALSHTFTDYFQDTCSGPRVVFAGHNLSEDYLAELMDLMSCRNVACVVISKSGTTTEPAIAFRFVKAAIEARYGRQEAASRIVAVTDRSRGALRILSESEGYRSFVIDDSVGGRYSVLSPVGLLPVSVSGFDVEAMVRGAKDAQAALSGDDVSNPAVRYAAMRNALYDSGKKIEIFGSFNPKLQYFGEWLKQLFGESEGKGHKGLFPAYVTCTTDLHSIGQYIQDGERNLFETMITVKNTRRYAIIEETSDNLDGLNYLSGKSVGHCNRMAQTGTRLAHIDGGVPNIEIAVESLDEYNLGYMFYFFEKVCGISGYMLGINPFDQPGVEAYKKNMFALLGKPGYEKETEQIRKRME